MFTLHNKGKAIRLVKTTVWLKNSRTAPNKLLIYDNDDNKKRKLVKGKQAGIKSRLDTTAKRQLTDRKARRWVEGKFMQWLEQSTETPSYNIQLSCMAQPPTNPICQHSHLIMSTSFPVIGCSSDFWGTMRASVPALNPCPPSTNCPRLATEAS